MAPIRTKTGSSRASHRAALARSGALAVVAALVLGACDGGAALGGRSPTGLPVPPSDGTASTAPAVTPSAAPGSAGAPATRPAASPLTLQPYAAAGAGQLTGAAVRAKRLVYVPNQLSGSMQVIDPATYRVVARYPVPTSPEHVVPAWDLSRLWVNSDAGNALTPVDPVTGRPGTPVAVRDPYNLYFTPDGRFALVMASRFRAIDVLDARTMRLVRSIPVPMCAGVNHADYTADLLPFILLMAFGMGLTFVPLTLTAVHHLRAEDSGIGSGVLNTMQQVGGATGLALLATLATQVFTDRGAELAAAGQAAAAQGGPQPTPEQAQALQLAIQGQVFAEGSTQAFLLGTGLMLAASLVVWVFLDVDRHELATDGPGGAPVHVG